MTRFLIIRLIQTVIALFGIMVLVFFLVRASGNPVDLMRSSTSTPEQIEQLTKNLGLDKSYPEQFWIFVSGLARGDLGDSLIKTQTVNQMVAQALPNTLKIGLPAFILGMLIAVALGILAAVRRDSIWDNGVKFLAILGQALPGFWVGIMAMLLFTVNWKILPTPLPTGTDQILYFILPVGTMMFFLLPGMMRLVRSSMLDVLDSEYIKLARIKGLPERVVIWKHALRNALIAPLTTAGMIFAMLIQGAVITENIFNWPGMGRLIIEATIARDFPVVQSITILVAVMVLGMNLLVDISYAYVDPQIRYEKS